MNLSTMASRIRRRTHTDTVSFADADMLIALNASYEYYTAIIRRKLDNYRPTLWTSGDLSTGTAEPKFDSLFHDLIPLRVILEYAGEGVIPVSYTHLTLPTIA